MSLRTTTFPTIDSRYPLRLRITLQEASHRTSCALGLPAGCSASARCIWGHPTRPMGYEQRRCRSVDSKGTGGKLPLLTSATLALFLEYSQSFPLLSCALAVQPRKNAELPPIPQIPHSREGADRKRQSKGSGDWEPAPRAAARPHPDIRLERGQARSGEGSQPVEHTPWCQPWRDRPCSWTTHAGRGG